MHPSTPNASNTSLNSLGLCQGLSSYETCQLHHQVMLTLLPHQCPFLPPHQYLHLLPTVPSSRLPTNPTTVLSVCSLDIVSAHAPQHRNIVALVEPQSRMTTSVYPMANQSLEALDKTSKLALTAGLQHKYLPLLPLFLPLPILMTQQCPPSSQHSTPLPASRKWPKHTSSRSWNSRMFMKSPSKPMMSPLTYLRYLLLKEGNERHAQPSSLNSRYQQLCWHNFQKQSCHHQGTLCRL